MSERLQYLGRLREKELQAKELGLKIKGLIDSLRLKLDPFEKIEELETALIAQQSMELATVHIEYIGITEEIKALKKALGKV